MPKITTLQSWLERLDIPFYQCDTCDALHLLTTQKTDDGFNIKLNLNEDVLFYIVMIEIRPTALINVVAELSQLNNASPTMKVFIDVEDHSLPKLIFCQSVSVAVGLTFSQFEHFIFQAQEQATFLLISAQEANWLFNEAIDGKVIYSSQHQQIH